jgi:lysozyme
MLAGVDVASYQGPPSDWRAGAPGLEWAAVKFTELEPGGMAYLDPYAGADWAWLAEQGKLRIGYLFGHPSVPAAAQAALFAASLNDAGLRDSDGIALDFEVTDGLPAAEVAQWAVDLCGLLRRDLGRTPVVYTYLAFAYAGNCDGLGGYPLWIADPSSPPGQPQVPAPWTSWAIHQYSISGQVDQDIAIWDTPPAMAATVGKPAPAPDGAGAKEDDTMRIPLPAGAVELFTPWPDVPAGQPGPYGHVSLVLTGQAGAQVTVEFWRGGPDPSGHQVHDLADGVAVPVAPVHDWPGITAVTLTRADTTSAAAAADVTRW